MCVKTFIEELYTAVLQIITFQVSLLTAIIHEGHLCISMFKSFFVISICHILDGFVSVCKLLSSL